VWRSLKRWRLAALLALTAIVVSVVVVPHVQSVGGFEVVTPHDAQAFGEFELGIVSGRDSHLQPRWASGLGAKVVRVEFSIDDSPRQMAPVIGEYAWVGVRVLPLASFEGRIPSRAESENLASWAAAFGVGGAFWRDHPGGGVAIRDIEFGNETSYGYQFGGCGPGCSEYRTRAREYALAFARARQALTGSRGNPHVGLLAQADYGGDGDEWVNGMFEAVPNLARLVAGWTVHPYGPRSRWQESLDSLVGQTHARGAPASIPIYITEFGITSDNGQCLSENYGWNPCMTYAQAGQALSATVNEIRKDYAPRIRSIFIYQLTDERAAGEGNNREDYFGVLREDGAPKGDYTAAVRALLRTNP
jgi:hypothetical protein